MSAITCKQCNHTFEANVDSNMEFVLCPQCNAVVEVQSSADVETQTNIDDGKTASGYNVHRTTQRFIDNLEKAKYRYHVIEHTKEKPSDVIDIPMRADNLPGFIVRCLFNKDEERAAIYVYNVLKVPENKVPQVPTLISHLQKEYIFARWRLDTADNTLQAEWFGNVSDTEVSGELFRKAVGRMARVVDDCYPLIMQWMYAQNPDENKE